jgi:RHS repeat-associated protein
MTLKWSMVMPNKSGISEQVISLPKGGGALQGMGEKFQPDLYTGTGNFSIPIAIPSGRNGIQPQLNLAYSTGNGNGPFGLGWGLGIPNIIRKTNKGIPRYQDQDTFILAGAEDLVLTRQETDQNTGITKCYYRPRTEGSFARIIHQTNGYINYWEVKTKNGLTNIYGDTETSRIYDHHPDCADHIFQWLLSETRDQFGNRIVYTYKAEDKAGLEQQWYEENHSYNQVYLSTIKYVNYLPENETREKFLFSIEFDYGEYPDDEKALMITPSPLKEWMYRPDPFSFYRAGFEIRTVRRCRRILIKVHEHTSLAAGQLTKAYQLHYLDQMVKTESKGAGLPLNEVSLLAEVTVTGYRDGELESFPPLTFNYTSFEPEKRKYENFSANGSYMPECALNDSEYELIDLHGFGLPDVIHASRSGFRYWRNLGNCRFDYPQYMRKAPPGIALSDPGVQFADMEGNGTADLLVTGGPITGYFPTQFNAQWDSSTFRKYQQAPSFNLKDPDVKLIDMNGDGIIDVLKTDNPHFLIFYNRGRQGWDELPQHVSRRNIEEFPDVYFSASDQQVRLGAVSGEGLQDIVLIHDRLIQYWPNLGYGEWGRRITMRHAPQLPPNYDPRRLFLNDIDGDGYADLVYVDFGRVHYWINQSGNAWSEEQVIEGTPSVTNIDAIRVADMKGTGTAGILWTYDYSPQNQLNYKYLDLTGEIKPYLLCGIDNNIGAVTQIAYAPSSQFAVADREKGLPWLTHLPFPVQVVERVEVADLISGNKLVMRYAYHHGFWDGIEREFRGFGLVEQFDAETLTEYDDPGFQGDSERLRQHFSPPTLTKTWFHQGAIGGEEGEGQEVDYSKEFWIDDPQMLSRPEPVIDFLNSLPPRIKYDALRSLRGSILRTEFYALDNCEHQERPYFVTEYLYAVREEEPLNPNEAERVRIFFPYSIGERTTRWERGTEPLTQFNCTEDYDEYGQPCKQINVACPRGWRKLEDIPGQPYLATRSHKVFAKPLDSQTYIMDRVAKTTSYEVKNDGQQKVFEIKNLPDESPSLLIIGQTVNFYDGRAFLGLPFGQIGKYGILARSEELVLTEDILQKAYGNNLPPYLNKDDPGWTADYPKEFQILLSKLAGYHYQPGGIDSEYAAGYFATTARRCFDFHDNPQTAQGLLKIQRDPLGNDTAITYDPPYNFLPSQVTDPVGLTFKAKYDYLVLQPVEITNQNGNQTSFTFTPMGLLEASYVKGKNNEGDQKRSSVTLKYDFLAFTRDGVPINIRTIRQVHHDTEVEIPFPDRDETIETIEYSDGFGRLIQTRTQGEEIRFSVPDFGSDENILPNGQSVNVSKPAIIGTKNPDSSQPYVVVSGWQIYDNKGRVVEKYEPFFAEGWEYVQPLEEKNGQKVLLKYDPCGRVIKIINPDGSEQRTVYGIPYDLDDPGKYNPTAWETYIYDANDNAGDTHPKDTTDYQHHWNTPANIVIDALGRKVQSIERNRHRQSDGSWSPVEEYHTYSSYDIQGKLIKVIDTLGREALKQVYELTPNSRPLWIESIDGGVRRTVLDPVGNIIEQRDSKGALILHGYDRLNRPTRLWARDGNDQPVTLRECLEYGDGSEPNQPIAERDLNRSKNRLGRLSKHYDEAGMVSFERYDFKANGLEKNRQVIKNNLILKVFDAALADNWQVQTFRVDWQPPVGKSFLEHTVTLLDEVCYQTSVSYDALNRVKTMQYPDTVDGTRKILRPHYNRAGVLERLECGHENYVDQIAYNARGQRILIAYGNNVITSYTYDKQTFRLIRQRTECYSKLADGSFAYQPQAPVMQDLFYKNDLMGNLLQIIDCTPESGYINNYEALQFQKLDPALAQLLISGDALIRRFQYDPLYRLVFATGRESKDIPIPRPWTDDPSQGFNTWNNNTPSPDNAPNLTTGYWERYTYDPVGNMLSLSHGQNGSPSSWTRYSGFGGLTPEQWAHESQMHFKNTQGWSNPPSNQLTYIGDSQDSPLSGHQFDGNGNLAQEGRSRFFEWDYRDHLRAYRNQTGNVQPSLYAHYLYDADGQRVLKLVRKQGGNYELTIYIDGLFEYHRLVTGDEIKENNIIQIMAGEDQTTLLRVGEPLPDDGAPELTVKYCLEDHLGSCCMVIGGNTATANNFINREEYTPYGETCFGSFAKKRYRFTGKERDEESGLYYHGARYYAPWLTRWISCDPAGMVDGVNLYSYARNGPIQAVDRSGLQTETCNQYSSFDSDYNYDQGQSIPYQNGPVQENNLSGVQYQETLLIYTDEELEKEQCIPSEHPTIYIKQQEISEGPGPNTIEMGSIEPEPPVQAEDEANDIPPFEAFPNSNSWYFPTLEAYNCLEPLQQEALNVNRGGVMNQESLICRYFKETGTTTMGSQIEDAIGHCYIGCEGSKRCGDEVAEKFSKMYENYREIPLLTGEHDSYTQDLMNEAWGRYFGRQNYNCAEACLNAAVNGKLDLSAPDPDIWVKGPTRPNRPCTFDRRPNPNPKK